MSQSYTTMTPEFDSGGQGEDSFTSTSTVSVEEFRWNFKRLLREGFPEGIPLLRIPEHYTNGFGKVVTPGMFLGDDRKPSKDWRSVFTGISTLNETFHVFVQENLSRVRVRKGPELSYAELNAVLKLVEYSKYQLMRLDDEALHRYPPPPSPDSTAARVSTSTSDPGYESSQSGSEGTSSQFQPTTCTTPGPSPLFQQMSRAASGPSSQLLPPSHTDSSNGTPILPILTPQSNPAPVLVLCLPKIDANWNSEQEQETQALGPVDTEQHGGNDNVEDMNTQEINPTGHEAEVTPLPSSVLNKTSENSNNQSKPPLVGNDHKKCTPELDACWNKFAERLEGLKGLRGSTSLKNNTPASSSEVQVNPGKISGTDGADVDADNQQLQVAAVKVTTGKCPISLNREPGLPSTDGESLNSIPAASGAANPVQLERELGLPRGESSNPAAPTVARIKREPGLPGGESSNPAAPAAAASVKREPGITGGESSNPAGAAAAASIKREPGITGGESSNPAAPAAASIKREPGLPGGESSNPAVHAAASIKREPGLPGGESSNPAAPPAASSAASHVQVKREPGLPDYGNNSRNCLSPSAPVQIPNSSSPSTESLSASVQPTAQMAGKTVTNSTLVGVVKLEPNMSSKSEGSGGAPSNPSNDSDSDDDIVLLEEVIGTPRKNTTGVAARRKSSSVNADSGASGPVVVGFGSVDRDQAVAGPSSQPPPRRSERAAKKRNSGSYSMDHEDGNDVPKKAPRRISRVTNLASITEFEELVADLMPEIINLINGASMEASMHHSKIERSMDIPADWLAFAVQGDPFETPNRGFFKYVGVGGNERVLRLEMECEWKRYESDHFDARRLRLPPRTMVYGEFVNQAEGTSGETVFHIIDVAILGGVLLSNNSYCDRFRLCKEVLDAFNKEMSGNNAIYVKVKPAANILEMKNQIFDRLVPTNEDGQEIFCLSDAIAGGEAKEAMIQITGIVFIKMTNNFENADFMFAMNNRFYWKWYSDLSILSENILNEEDEIMELSLFHFMDYFRRIGAIQDTP